MAAPKWLSEEDQQVWRPFIGAVRLLFSQLDHELQVDAGMPTAYYEILVSLSEAPDRMMRMSDLAEFLRSSRSRLSHTVARLEEMGWVNRQPCPVDRRGSFAVLTEEGLATLTAAAPGHVAAVRKHLFDVLTPDQVRQLGEISTAICTGLAGSGAFGACLEEEAEAAR